MLIKESKGVLVNVIIMDYDHCALTRGNIPVTLDVAGRFICDFNTRAIELGLNKRADCEELSISQFEEIRNELVLECMDS